MVNHHQTTGEICLELFSRHLKPANPSELKFPLPWFPPTDAPENSPLRRCDRNGLRCCAFSAWGNWCLAWATFQVSVTGDRYRWVCGQHHRKTSDVFESISAQCPYSCWTWVWAGFMTVFPLQFCFAPPALPSFCSNNCIHSCFAHSQGLHTSYGNTVLIQCHLVILSPYCLFKHTGSLSLVKSHFCTVTCSLSPVVCYKYSISSRTLQPTNMFHTV